MPHTNLSSKRKSVKDVYTRPQIHVINIEMENGIAVGSATVSPVNSNNQVQEEFDQQEQVFDVNW